MNKSINIVNRLITLSSNSRNVINKYRYFTTTSSSSTIPLNKDEESVSTTTTTTSNSKFEEQKRTVKEAMEKPVSKFLKGEVLLEGIRNDGTSLRWYKKTGVSKNETNVNDKSYCPTIDDRKMKTPSNNIIITPSKEIAYAVASEWLAQEKYIKPSRLPITQTIITCMDIKPEGRKKIIGEFLNHLATDPICNREQNDSKLKSLQLELYDPVLKFANEYYGIPFTVSKHLEISHHSKELLNKIENHLNSMNNWELVCLQLISQSSKSYLVALSVYYGILKLDSLYQTIALEEEYQSETWGKIPFGHDLAECETHNEIAPPLFILRNMNEIPLPK